MKKFIGIAIIFFAMLNEASAGCMDGKISNCKKGDLPGKKECINGKWGPCEVEPEAEDSANGTVQPRYKILTVIYAPPGTKGGGKSSSVTYGSGSTTGSTVSVTKSFKQNYSISVSQEVGFLGTGGGVEGSFSYGRNSSDKTSLDIKKTVSTEISASGPSIDGIDHDRDRIWLWLNPSIKLSLTTNSAQWTLDKSHPASQPAILQYVYIGWLKKPSDMPPGVMASLQKAGITTQDFEEIMKADPYATTIPAIDTNRFKALHTTFPYEPPYAPGESPDQYKYAFSSSGIDTHSSSVMNQYKVGLKISGSANFLTLSKTSIKGQSEWEWTDTVDHSTSIGSSESASAIVTGPSYGYNGSTNIEVYYDLLYKTFLFKEIPIDKKPSMRGLVVNRLGKTVGGKEVVLVANGVKYRTFTNAKGEYRIFGKLPSERFTIEVDGIKKQITPAPNELLRLRMESVNIELP